jgi:hypothetical protein
MLAQAVLERTQRAGDVRLGGPAVQGVVVGGTEVPQHGIGVSIAASVHGSSGLSGFSYLKGIIAGQVTGRDEGHQPPDFRPETGYWARS